MFSHVWAGNTESQVKSKERGEEGREGKSKGENG